MQRLAVLGSTGSIGKQTLDVVKRHPDLFSIEVLVAGQQVSAMTQQCLAFRPRHAVMADQVSADALRAALSEQRCQVEVSHGAEAMCWLMADAEIDTVVAAIVGAAGVLPTLAAVRAGKRILLANKEALVVTGALFMDAVREHNATLLPVDSEHNAIFQCLPGGAVKPGVERLLLTASGGPFRTFTRDQLDRVTVAQALNHPNWDMGPKISIDSATLMNKGLEFIEACWLFDVSPDNVDVVVHPQSVVHSMVSYSDGSVLAQMGLPDMRTPIAYALGWPERIGSGVAPLDLTALSDLSFEAPDTQRFPCLALARQAMMAGGTTTAVLNAANEEAVAAFLGGKLGFMGIAALVEHCLSRVAAPVCSSVSEVLEVDGAARRAAQAFVEDHPC